jgi:hypothetical protein
VTKVGKIVAWLLRSVGLILWSLLGLWTALAVYFTAPVALWAAVILAIAVVGLYASTLRERLYVYGRAGLRWRDIPRSAVALAVSAVVILWFCTRKPDPNQDWESYHMQMPIVQIEGDKVKVKNVRNFTWRTTTDFTPAYYERVYDVNLINSAYYLVVPLRGLDIVAHVFVCFGFSDGQYLAVSVEGRRPKGVPFKVLDSMFQQYQLIYAVGDERDIIGMRATIRNDPIRFYPATSTNDRKRVLFMDMLRRAHHLEDESEFYHLITNNCMNNLSDHLRCLGGRPLPSDFQLLFTGFTDRMAYDFGYIDTDLPFDKAREVFLIDDWIRSTTLDDTFSKRLREMLDQRVAEAHKSLGR